MTKTHKKRLAKLAIALLENYDGKKIHFGKKELRFRMNSYSSGGVAPNEVHTCGTSCCFAGYAPTVFPACRKMADWDEVCGYFGSHPDKNRSEWSFLFDLYWDDEPKQAASRALWLLERGLPDVEVNRYFTSFSKVKLIERLQKQL